MNFSDKVVFVDRITLFSWVKIWFRARPTRTVWHFESLSPFWTRWLSLGRRIGLISCEVRQVDCHVGHVRNKSGRSDYVQVLQSIKKMTDAFRDDLLKNHSLVRAMEPEWSSRKVALHFEKLVEQSIRLECLRLYLAEWILRSRLGLAADQGILLIRHSPWHSQLKTFARSAGVPLASYRQSLDLPMFYEGFRKFFPRFLRLVRRIGYRIFNSSNAQKKSTQPSETQAVSASALALHYWHRNLGFDPTERSEFFWLNESGLLPSEIILHDYTSDRPLDETTRDILEDRGIRVFGRAPQVPLWHATPLAWRIVVRKMLHLVLATLACLLHGRRISFHDLRCLCRLITDYAYWYDFFKHHHVRVNVGTFNASVGQTLALEDLGGVNMSYQISISNLIFPTRLLTTGENVQFVFSPLFETLWHQIKAPTDMFVHTGFIYDGAIKSLRSLERIKTVRKNLQANGGARFIICFFDENANAANQWDIPSWAEDIRRDYEFFLQWLLEDPTLGIVFKPKHSPLLFQRLSAISTLLEEARQTGRCHFMTSGQIYGSVFPAEAALAADVCVGKLMGGTAALEAQLAGVPTLMVDLEDFHDHPLRNIAQGGIVFDSWSDLRKAIEAYRVDPKRHSGFGKWIPGLRQLDPFQDGNASARIGSYIRSVYEALKSGVSRNEALAAAARHYADRWGEGHTVPGAVSGRHPFEIVDSAIQIHVEQTTTN